MDARPYEIWKHQFEELDHGVIDIIQLPRDAQFLAAQEQNGLASIWFLCDPQLPIEIKHIACYGTGKPFGGFSGKNGEAFRGCYIGTVQINTLVWHFFDVTNDQGARHGN
jgi:hypothetical protein